MKKRKISFSSLGKWRLHIILALVIVIAIVVLLNLNSRKAAVSFEIEDRCGLIPGGAIEHTIEDESMCRVQCRNQCSTRDLEFLRVEFAEEALECNKCMCYCK